MRYLELYWGLPSFRSLYWNFPYFTDFYSFLIGFRVHIPAFHRLHRKSIRLIEFYRVVPSFAEFYRVFYLDFFHGSQHPLERDARLRPEPRGPELAAHVPARFQGNRNI